MKLISQKEFLQIRSFDLSQFPFCMQSDYLKLYPNISMLEHEHCYSPVKITKTKSFKSLQFQFPPLTAEGLRLTPKKEKEFCEEAITYISENDLAHRIPQPTNYCLFNAIPKNVVSAEFGTYRIQLDKLDQTELLQKMQPRYRTAINQVSKLNVTIKFGLQELKSFQKLHKETMNRTSAYFEGYSTLEKEILAMPHNTLLATVYLDNELQGGVFIFYSAYGAYYFHGASADTTQASGAIKYLHYKVMCLLLDKKVKCYDFVGARLSNIEGTKFEGIQNFKKRFGSELVKGYLWKSDINKNISRSFDLLLKIKCKLKGTRFPKDIIDQEKNQQLI